MQRKISRPVALLTLVILILVAAAISYRASESTRAQGQVSPEFLKLSPAEQQEALATAERLRRLRGAPVSPP
jgi:hypothetical protein